MIEIWEVHNCPQVTMLLGNATSPITTRLGWFSAQVQWHTGQHRMLSKVSPGARLPAGYIDLLQEYLCIKFVCYRRTGAQRFTTGLLPFYIISKHMHYTPHLRYKKIKMGLLELLFANSTCGIAAVSSAFLPFFFALAWLFVYYIFNRVPYRLS